MLVLVLVAHGWAQEQPWRLQQPGPSSCPSTPLGALTLLTALQSLTLWCPGTLTPHLGPVKTQGKERIWAG